VSALQARQLRRAKKDLRTTQDDIAERQVDLVKVLEKTHSKETKLS